MTWVAAAVVTSAAIGYAGSQQAAKSAKKAGKTSANAAKYQAELQQQQYEQARQDQAPWRGAGELGLGALAYGLGLSPTGYVQGMSDQTAGAFGQNALAYSDASKMLGGGDQWEIIKAPGYKSDMQVRNAVTGEVRSVPLWTEKNPNSLKRAQVANALSAGWGLSGTESVPTVGTMISGPMSKPTDAQTAEAQRQMAALGGGGSGGGVSGNLLGTGVEYGDLLRKFGASDFEADPGYAFRQAEGQKAIERSAAAGGGLLSGRAMKGIERFGQDLASQEYQSAYNRFNNDRTNIFNRLASMAGVGQTANAALQGAGQNYANAMTNISHMNAANQGNAQLAAGNARASGYLGIGNTLGNAFANWGGGGATTPNVNTANSWGFGQNMGYSTGEWA